MLLNRLVGIVIFVVPAFVIKLNSFVDLLKLNTLVETESIVKQILKFLFGQRFITTQMVKFGLLGVTTSK